MKILFDGLIDDSLLTATYGSQSYPVANIQDEFLKKRFQSTRDMDQILVEFPEISDVSSFWYGYTNAIEIIFELFDDDDNPLYTASLEYPTNEVDAFYFNTITNVAYAVVTLIGDSIGVYIGRFDFGIPYTFPDPLAAWSESIDDKSVVYETRGGQSTKNKGAILRIYFWEFKGATRTEMNDIRKKIVAYGIGQPLFIDGFNLNHDFIEPLWGKITEHADVIKNGKHYNHTLNIKECK